MAVKKLTDLTNNPVQVDSAIKDGKGQVIHQTYAEQGNVVLSNDLYTYYNIGKVQNASGTSPVKIGDTGDTIWDVLNNLTQMDELQPSKTDPSLTLAISYTGNREQGTEISTLNYAITTNNGSYTYDTLTGVTWSEFAITGDGDNTPSSSLSGIVTLDNTYVVGTSGQLSFTCVGTHSAGNIAKTNLGNNSNPIVQIAAGTKTRTVTYSITTATYPYYASSATTSIPTSGTRANSSLTTASGDTIGYTQNQYLWVFSTTNSNLKIQIYSDIAQEWADMLGGTEAPQSVTFTMSNGKTRTYYGYRTTNVSQSTGTAKIRLV